jgi:hypothetical protein
MIIEGKLIEIGVLNKNRWGIGSEGADELLKSLAGMPIKICKDRGHGCDYNYTYQPGKKIGIVMSAAKKDNFITTSATIFDRDAERKIRHGKYPHNWSIYLSHRNISSDGFISGLTPIGISLVNSPAYLGSSYSIYPALTNISQVLDFAGIPAEVKMQYLASAEKKQLHKESGDPAGRPHTFVPAGNEFSDLERHYLAPEKERNTVDHGAALENALLRLKNRGKQ